MKTDLTKTLYPTGLPVVYAVQDYPRREDVECDLDSGEDIKVYRPGGDPVSVLENGMMLLVGPHYPERHTWQAVCQIKDQIVVEIKPDRPWIP